MNTVVFNFGRFNPPTIGHEKLSNAILAIAHKLDAVPRIYLSHSFDNKKNPIPYDQKLTYAKKAFGDIVHQSTATTIIQIMQELEADGFTDVVFVAGEDRSSFVDLLIKQNGVDYSFKSVKFASAGKRDPDAEGAEGMSASKLREAALSNNFKLFFSGLPSKLKTDAEDIFNTIRTNIKTKTKQVESKKTPWAKIVTALKADGIDLDQKDKVAQDAIKNIKKASADYNKISQKPLIGEDAANRTYPTGINFPDGEIWISDHLLNRIKERHVDTSKIAELIKEAIITLKTQISNLDAENFVIRKKSGFGIAIKKWLMANDTFRYVIMTVHDTLKFNSFQKVFAVEHEDLNVHYHNELNPVLFNQSNEMHPLVQYKLLKIAEDFTKSIGIKLSNLIDITISGSNAAYSYTPFSDIDLHIVIDTSYYTKKEVWEELFNAKKYQYNTMHDIKIKGIDVELYVQDINEPHVSQGVYSILNNNWIEHPEHTTFTYNETNTIEKYDMIKDLIIQSIETDSQDLAEKLKTIIKKYRVAGLHENGEFGPENLAFKALRTNGWIEKLFNFINAKKDSKLSLEHIDENKRSKR